jgi:DNA-binding NarL/FixJ family response regulator
VHSVAVLDDDPAGRARLAALVRGDPRLRLAAVGPAAPPPPGCAAGVLALPAGPAPAMVDLVVRVAGAVPVVVVSGWDRAPTLGAVIAAGARGGLPRDAGPDTVLAALRTVAAGGFYLGERLAERFTAELFRPRTERPSGLAPREIETLRWIASGYTQSQIATRMGLSQATVNTYAKRIRHKLKVNNKAELTRMAVEFGYVGPRRRHPAA